MDHLLAVIAIWLSTTLGLPPAKTYPAIRYVPPARLAVIFYGTASNSGDVVALYEGRTRTILLAPGWTATSVTDLSVLVHEMVHHLQKEAGLKYPCPQAREALAFEAQERWLKTFGTSLEAEFGIDPLTLKLRTECLPI